MSANLNVPLSKLTGAKQTMLSWARVIESYAEIPDAYKSSCKAVLENCHPFPYVVLAPINSDAGRKATEKLICEINDVLHIWEHVGSQIVSISYPLKTIYSFEAGNILLFSWFTINGLSSDGTLSSTVITFNTATGRLLSPFIKNLRPTPTGVDEAIWLAELAKFDRLSSANFKFMNYARESLMHGEKVIHFIVQPTIRKNIFTLFGYKFYRTLALSHFALLTDKEVIFIRDDEQSPEIRGKAERYGGVWQYVPLRNIASVELIEAVDGLITLSLKLTYGNQKLNKVFEASSKKELENFKKNLEQIIG